MKHLRRAMSALSSADAIGAAGIACLAFGAGLAWPPAGFVTLGIFLIAIARTEDK